MGKTITMRHTNGRFADIHDSTETIAQAQRDGYHVCTDAELEAYEALNKADAQLNNDVPKKRGRKKADNTAGATDDSDAELEAADNPNGE